MLTNARFDWAMLCLKLVEKNPSLPHPSFCWFAGKPWHALPCRCSISVSASIFTWCWSYVSLSSLSIKRFSCWSWSSSTLATRCEEPTHWKIPWCWERLRTGGERDDRGWDGWMSSLTQWTWVWVSSGRWWRIGNHGVLQSMRSQRVGHDWATEQHLGAKVRGQMMFLELRKKLQIGDKVE